MALVSTIHGEMDDSVLQKKEGVDNIPEGDAHWTEYWFEGQLVHRSVHLYMKEGLSLFGEAAALT